MPCRRRASASITGYGGVKISGGAGTVVNDGGIAGTGTSWYGIYLKAGGSVTNAASASISGYDAVQLSGALGIVVNDGSITGTGGSGIFGLGVWAESVTNAASASIMGFDEGVSAGNGVNYGSISSRAADGVDLPPGGVVTNAPSASITGSLSGVSAYRGGVTVINEGSIGAMDKYEVGVYLFSGGLVTNAAGFLADW